MTVGDAFGRQRREKKTRPDHSDRVPNDIAFALTTSKPQFAALAFVQPANGKWIGSIPEVATGCLRNRTYRSRLSPGDTGAADRPPAQPHH
jgi:hypothetical protein